MRSAMLSAIIEHVREKSNRIKRPRFDLGNPSAPVALGIRRLLCRIVDCVIRQSSFYMKIALQVLD